MPFMFNFYIELNLYIYVCVSVKLFFSWDIITFHLSTKSWLPSSHFPDEKHFVNSLIENFVVVKEKTLNMK